MKTIGLARLGRDAEIRYTAGGDAVCNLSLAVSYGQKKEGEQYRPTQWIDASLWGKRAESLAPYLTKNSMHCFTLDEIHIEDYEGRNGSGHKLVARVVDVELGPSAGDAPAARERPKEQQPRQQSAAQHQHPQQGNVDDDDSVPF